jgi:hypothetical protein
LKALCAKATALRNGVSCDASLPGPGKSLSALQFGGFNLHVDIKFSDGVTWIARFRLLKINRPHTEKINFDRLSEVAVYSHLKQTTIPVPTVYDFADDGNPNNVVGVGYILMKKLPGHPMDWSEASTKQKRHIFRQLKDFYLQIEKIPLKRIGRPLLPNDKNPGHGTQVGLSFFDYDEQSRCIPRGPFSTASEWYQACLNHRKGLILSGEIASCAPDDAIMVNRYLSDNISRVVDSSTASGPFYLKHPDSRDCNFLVDNDFNITGIIDWELASFVPRKSAFQCPLFMMDMDAVFGKGQPAISEDEELFAQEFEKAGRPDMARTIREAKKQQVFELSMYADPHMRDQFDALFAAAWRAIEGSGKPFTWDGWKKANRHRYLM